MWLLSARTTLALLGAAAGIILAREVAGLSPLLAVIVGRPPERRSPELR